MKNAKIIGLLIGTALLATACGGGGSGGGTAAISKPTPPAVVTPTKLTLAPAEGITAYQINGNTTIASTATVEFSNGESESRDVTFESGGDISSNGQDIASFTLSEDDVIVTADGYVSTFTVQDLGVDIVSYGSDDSFFITNAATGTPLTTSRQEAVAANHNVYTGFRVNADGTSRRVLINVADGGVVSYNRLSSHSEVSSSFVNEIKDAHSQGWTGQSATITYIDGPSNTTLVIAPNAIHLTDENINSAYEVSNNSISNDVAYATEDHLSAGVAALVISKFDTLTGSMAGSIVDQTAAEFGAVSPAAALSPVGNLR